MKLQIKINLIYAKIAAMWIAFAICVVLAFCR